MPTGAEVAMPPVEPTGTPRLVLFDFDGVLFRGDAFALFMRQRYRDAWWRQLLLLPALPWLLLRWPISWKLPVRTLVHIALLGVGERRYRLASAAFAAQLARRPRQFSRDGLLALRRHQAAGDRVIVVTGCERLLVRGLLDELGLGEVEAVASELRPGWLGMRVKRHNVGRRKVQALADLGIGSWQLAYSDSFQDMPMLKLATEAVLVNGTPALCKRVEKVLGRASTRVAWY